MGDMLIRNLDDAVIAALEKRAAENCTSLEEEARRALSGSRAAISADDVVARLAAVRARIGPLPGPNSTEILRWDRDRDDRAIFYPDFD